MGKCEDFSIICQHLFKVKDWKVPQKKRPHSYDERPAYLLPAYIVVLKQISKQTRIHTHIECEMIELGMYPMYAKLIFVVIKIIHLDGAKLS